MVSSSTVVPPANTTLLTARRRKGSWVNTAWKPSPVQCPGHSRAGSAYRSAGVRKATPSIHRNGTRVARAAMVSTVQASTRATVLAVRNAGTAHDGGSGANDASLVVIAVPQHSKLDDGHDD